MTVPGTTELVRPAPRYLESYVSALRRGWSPNNLSPDAAAEELARIDDDADAFLDSLEDRAGAGPPIALPDGSVVPRLPGFRRWVWDGEFCGSIGLRWQPGTAALPAHVLGHAGYAVVPWKRREGHATAGLRLLLPLAAEVGLPHIDLTTTEDNLASQRVILANGGVLEERFAVPAAYGGGEALRYRIVLTR